MKRRNTKRKVRRNSRRNFRWMRGGVDIKSHLMGMNLGTLEGFSAAKELVERNMVEFKELTDG